MSLTFMPSLFISDCLCTHRYNPLKDNKGFLCNQDRYIEVRGTFKVETKIVTS